ncbi:hypothetical protein KBD87_00465 [Candidatus Saccharibacteria bacterium]|nr:hypothetical protein [Candidatus Saccharibacteria bacterium]
MKTPQKSLFKFLAFGGLTAGLVLQTLAPSSVMATQITARSLTLQAGASDGGSKPGGTVNHLFQFTLPAVGDPSVGSIKLQYCTTAGTGTCTTPTGLHTDGGSVALGSQTGATGFSLNKSTDGSPYLTRTAASITAGTTVSYRLDSVVNPTTKNQTFFVRISTYASTDTTGSAIDAGTVAASTADPVVITGTMPESLVFCTGAAVSKTSGVPDCSTATSASNITFDQLFSPTDTAVAFSQMAASTNAGTGYVITVNGATLTSGIHTITGIGGTQDTSKKGISQFGMNVVANTATAAPGFPGISAAADPVANGIAYYGAPASNYNTADNFAFQTGNTVASSPNGTDAQIYTASYIANVPGSLPAGDYSTTLTYICTPTF